MKNRFTQNVSIAAAVAMAISGGTIFAANKTVTTPLQLSSESLSLNATAVNSPEIAYTLGQSVDNGDFLILTLTGATPASVDGTVNVTCSTADVDFAMQDFDAGTSTVRLRATGRTVNDPAGTTCTVPAAAFTMTAASIGSSTATFVSTMRTGTGAVDYDAGSTATALLFASSQFTASIVTSLDQVIDVEQSRGNFSAGLTNDVMVVKFSNAANKLGADGTASSNVKAVRYTGSVTGDFSFLDDTGGGCVLADVGAGAGSLTVAGVSAAQVVTGSVTSINTACSVISFNLEPGTATPGAAADYHATLTFSKGSTAAPSLVAGGFTVSTAVNYANAAASSTATANYASFGAGSWSYSGFVAVVPFMPIQDSFSNTVYLTNRSTQSGGNISVTAYAPGATPCTFTLTGVNPTASSPVNIGGRIKTQIRSCAGMATGNLRLSLVITSPLPAATTELVTQYTDTANNRTVVVPNSSTTYRSGT